MKALLVLTLLTGSLFSQIPEPIAAAEKFLATLDSAQRTKAALPFTSDERENFRYTPQKPPNERAGLPIKEMSDNQRLAAMNLLHSAVSEKASLKIEQIMSLEGLLAELEKDPIRRDPSKYFVAIYGTPSTTSPWGWRFEGHHCSINMTLIPGKGISVTPSFLGSSPAEIRNGPRKGLRILAAEEELARTLVNTLLAGGKSEVIFSEKPPGEIISGEKRNVSALDPVGILARDMTESQRTALQTLIQEYTGRYRSDVAATDLKRMKDAGLENIRFGWAGGTKFGEPYYYRIQGPTFLMEGANTQNQSNHLHATWRDFDGDFGRDLLREHLAGDH
jgi:Protein of unknown function (DUF3500)